MFTPLTLAFFETRCQNLHFPGVKQGSEATGSSAMMKHSHSRVVKMLKMGSSGHMGSTQGVYAWKVVKADEWSALREARCNQSTKMGMTTSSLVD